MEKDYKEYNKKLKKFSQRTFACKADAVKATDRLLNKSKYHRLTKVEIQSVLNKEEKDYEYYEYRVEATVSICEEKIEPERKQAGRFIIATNVMDRARVNSEAILSLYKDRQQSVERGFGFMKDPMFFTDSVFLKSPKRIEALGLIMVLSLLVYKVAERQIRQTLERRRAGVKNQLGHLTARPTLRWLFHSMFSVNSCL